MAYRIEIRNSEAAANGNVHLDVWVQSDRSGEWLPVPNGHRTLVMNGDAVLEVTGGAGTDQEKRAALLALFKEEVKSWGIDKSDNANRGLEELVPEWPITVGL